MTPSGGDIIADRFQLIRELGRGAMGSVWLADHLTLEVRCAVKLIGGDGVRDPDDLARFHVEARAIAQVQSPHVARVLDHDIWGDVPYIAMELLQGEDLRTYLQRERRLDPLATCKIVSQIARALSKAHAVGVVHRDLKPENVFLAEDDGEVVVKLLDFGIATWAGSRVTPFAGAAEGLVGTPEYMSPEHLRGMSALDHRADLWALAVIAFECLTGQLPFEAATMSELFDRMLDPLAAPSGIVPDLPPEIDGWWRRAASPSIDARFQSARELSRALGRALGADESGRSTSPPPTEVTQSKGSPSGPAGSPPEPSWRRRQRRFGYLVAAAGMTVALVLPFAAYGDVARSGAGPRPRRADETAANAAGTRPLRTEASATPSPVPTPPTRLSTARLPRSVEHSPARPSPRDSADAVLGI